MVRRRSPWTRCCTPPRPQAAAEHRTAIWAIDLDSETKPVVSWKTNGGPVVGAVAFAPDGTLFAAVGAGQTTGEGKANAIVALDPKTLRVKDWFTQPAAEFVTGPTILRHAGKDIVAAATTDGRILLLDATSLGGTDHATPRYASKTWLGSGARVSADALATWQQSIDGTTWILLPVAGPLASGAPPTNGAIPSWRGDRPEADRRGRRAVDGAGMGLAQPRGSGHADHGQRRGVHVGDWSRRRPRRAEARRRCCTRTTARRASASGTAASAMTTFASPGSFWTGLGQVYVGTHDGALYAFGFNDERRATNPGS